MDPSSAQDVNAPIVIPPLKDHRATLIFLHGLGDTGQGWALELKGLKFQHIKCICPHAPVQPVTVNRGMRMPSWFDVHTFHPDITEDEASVKEASQILQEHVENEMKNGIPSSRIFIGGISQGGAVAVYTAFVVDKPVAGVVGLSTWFPLYKTLDNGKVPKHNKDVPVLLCHGTADPLVKYSEGQQINQFLQTFNPTVEFKAYEGMEHTYCPQEVGDLKAFLEKLT